MEGRKIVRQICQGTPEEFVANIDKYKPVESLGTAEVFFGAGGSLLIVWNSPPDVQIDVSEYL